MSDLFHLWVGQEAAGIFEVWATAGAVKVDAGSIAYSRSADFSLALERLLERRAGLTVNNLRDQDSLSKTIGRELFTSFFAEPVLGLFRQYRAENDPPRVALHIPPTLYSIPWELLSDTQDA